MNNFQIQGLTVHDCLYVNYIIGIDYMLYKLSNRRFPYVRVCICLRLSVNLYRNAYVVYVRVYACVQEFIYLYKRLFVCIQPLLYAYV